MKYRHDKLMIVCLSFSSINCIHANAQHTHGLSSANEPSPISVSVHVSSLAGDRLAKEPDIQFTPREKSSAPIIKVDDNIRYQKIEGFGATFNEAGMICLNTLRVEDRDKVLQSLFDTVAGAGFSVMKSPIAACDFASAGPWYSYDETKDDTLTKHFSIERDLAPNGLITFINSAKRFGKFQIESPMDFAPDWMYYSLKAGEKHIRPEYYNALSNYYCKYLHAYQDNGITIDYLNLFNEANNSWYSNVTYQEMGEMIKNYVAPRLRFEGLTTKIQLGETANRPEALEKFGPALADADVRKYIHSLTVHGYDWDNFSSLTALHNAYPDLPIWQTEVCYALGNNVPPGGPSKLPVYDFADGEFWGNMIVNDLKNWASAWIYWNMILDEHGGPWLVSIEHGDPDNNVQHPVVIIDRSTSKTYFTGLYYYLAHFSKFVRPGAHRISSTGGTDKFNFVAFKNVDGSIVLNVINNGVEADCRVEWNNGMIIEKLPAHSINTFRWQAIK